MTLPFRTNPGLWAVPRLLNEIELEWILLSLSYLPTAERLTVVVVKAKNLVWTNVVQGPLVLGWKISKKKTAVKRDDTNPVFNEAMIFSVPAIELSLRVTVAECGEDGRADNTGHVLIGPAASGMGTTHWNQMLATLRRPVSMWHPLHCSRVSRGGTSGGLEHGP
uniref:Synaptotagmin 12 n=1 Tax=Strigops habroptila TaxID=2489341 RepID=A0A672TNE6_STRHB